jgi:hypothetical protein
MTTQSLQKRLDAVGLRLAETDLAPFAETLAETDRIIAWLRGVELSYADEPAVCFAAPQR